MFVEDLLGTMIHPIPSTQDFEYLKSKSLHQLAREGDVSGINALVQNLGARGKKRVNTLDENKVQIQLIFDIMMTFVF